MRKATFWILGAAAAVMFIASCASIGNPSGGPRDEDPPRFVTSTPLQGATEVTPNKVVLTFDELVNVKDAFTKVVVSPPPATTPRVSSLGRRVNVEFRDTLLPNTTYTIDFGDAIVDNNEGNKLENFIYTFSTGPILDSLMISGMVLDAQTLEAPGGIYVGLHSNPADSAFRKTRFDRIAKTNDDGSFVIGGLAPGQYRIYALDDRDGDLAWSSPEETLAFYDAIIEPHTEDATATDTIFNLLTGEIDTIVSRNRVKFLPNNILLRSFNTGYKQQYITKYERPDSARISLILNAAADSMPQAELILPDRTSVSLQEAAVTERSLTNDTITYWLRDKYLAGTDTLRLALTYLRADSAYNMVPVNDTLRLLKPKPNIKTSKARQDKKKVEADTVTPPVPVFEFKALNGKPEVNLPLIFESPEPLEEFDLTKIKLEFKEDSLWLPVQDFNIETIVTDSLNPRRRHLYYPWKYETAYKLTIDSLAAKNLYGIFNDDAAIEFTTRKESEYSSISFNLRNFGADTIPRFVDLLDGGGRIVKSTPLDDYRRVVFEYILPGKYNARIVEDRNGNGKWDPGIFDLNLQPDVSYYYPETIELKQNWSQELDWNVFSTPVDRMLPESLRKKKTNR